METIQNLFISHASSDKHDYILPLASALTHRKVTFWLDSNEISWGDSIALKINDGLRDSRYILLCLSNAFLARPWTESEMNTALTMQNEKGVKKVLPLILNSKQEVLKTYPIISGLAYREFSVGINSIADELATLVDKSESTEDKLQVIIESIHTGQLSNLSVSPKVSIKWLTEKARIGAGLQDFADVGSFEKVKVKWILIDSSAEKEWSRLTQKMKREIKAIIKTETGLKVAWSETEKLEDLNIYDGIVFHMYAVIDEKEKSTWKYMR